MHHYAADVVVFDVKPPFQTTGAAAWRRTWEASLPDFPDVFQTEMRDLSLTVSGDLALAHWLFRFTGLAKGHPALQTWMRSSAGYRRMSGTWQIVHEDALHPETSKAAFTLDPKPTTAMPNKALHAEPPIARFHKRHRIRSASFPTAVKDVVRALDCNRAQQPMTGMDGVGLERRRA